MKTKDKKSIIILTVLALILITSFLFIGVNSVNFKYALYRRIPKIYAMILTGAAIGFSSLIFQTVTNNRILTPSILGNRFTICIITNNYSVFIRIIICNNKQWKYKFHYYNSIYAFIFKFNI